MRPGAVLKSLRHARSGPTVRSCPSPVRTRATAQWNAQVIGNLIDHGMTVQEAAEAPRFHSFPGTDPANLGRPPVVKAEDRVPQASLAALSKLGHSVETLPAWGAGGAVQLVQFDDANGVLRGGTDPRPGGLALGF